MSTSTKKKTSLPKAPACCTFPGCERPGEGTPPRCGQHVADCGHMPREPHGCPLNKQGERHCDCCEHCTSVCEKRAAAGIGDLCSPGCTCTPYRAPELQCAAFKRYMAEQAPAGSGAAPPVAAQTAPPFPGLPPLSPELVSIFSSLGSAMGPHVTNPRTLRYVAKMLEETARFIEANQRAKLHAFCVDEGIETADTLQK